MMMGMTDHHDTDPTQRLAAVEERLARVEAFLDGLAPAFAAVMAGSDAPQERDDEGHIGRHDGDPA